MGSVWTAQHLALHTQVAVKFLAGHMVQDAAAAARFQREAMAAARIKSPHVVQIYDHGVSPELGPYIVMELLEGETLSAFVHRHGRLTPAHTARILSQLCRALGKAHALGVVHRDIKPDNVFLIDSERDAFVKVLDFGIAKNLREELSVTSTGALMGTPHYMSPEQMLSSKHVDLRADLWASAVLTYHAVTGQVPFDGETFGAVAIAVTQAEFGPPHARYGVGSPALDAWFARALARNIELRFGSADELAETFSAAIGVTSAAATANVVERVAPAVTLGASPGPGPTFAGVTNTVPGASHRRVYVAAAITTLAVGGAVALGATLLKARELAAPAITATSVAAVAPTAPPSSSTTTTTSSAPPAPSVAPLAAPSLSPSVPASPRLTAPPAPPRRRANPAATMAQPPAAGPARPDRGF
jgi:serine/threonine-protein kinase